MEVESLEVRQQDLIQSCMFMHERLPGQARTGQDRTGQDRTGPDSDSIQQCIVWAVLPGSPGTVHVALHFYAT
jgi:hypothetical protein